MKTKARLSLGTEKPKAVLNTNVFVAAYLTRNPKNPRAEFLRRWREGEFDLLYSHEIVYEVIRKFEERGILSRYAIALVSDLKSMGKYVVVSPSDSIPVIADDPDHDVFIASR